MGQPTGKICPVFGSYLTPVNKVVNMFSTDLAGASLWGCQAGWEDESLERAEVGAFFQSPPKVQVARRG